MSSPSSRLLLKGEDAVGQRDRPAGVVPLSPVPPPLDGPSSPFSQLLRLESNHGFLLGLSPDPSDKSKIHGGSNPLRIPGSSNFLVFAHQRLFYGKGEEDLLRQHGYVQFAFEVSGGGRAGGGAAQKQHEILYASAAFTLPPVGGDVPRRVGTTTTPETIQLIFSAWFSETDSETMLNLAYSVNDCRSAVVAISWSKFRNFLEEVPVGPV